MKSRSFLIALLMACNMSVSAQTLSFNIVYDEIESVRGELYQYSERYLGTKEAVKESGTNFVLRSISLQDEDTAVMSSKRNRHQHNCYRKFEKKQVAHLPALNEDALLASNTAKKAETVAKQIYRIREARIAILSGESEHTPADGKAMELTLKELNRQEEELTELFVGTTYSTRHEKTIEYTLNDSICEEVSDVMIRFSQFAGPVETDDLSGEPIQIVRHNKLAERPSSNKKAKKGATETFISRSKIEVVYDGKTLMENKLQQKEDTIQKK